MQWYIRKMISTTQGKKAGDAKAVARRCVLQFSPLRAHFVRWLNEMVRLPPLLVFLIVIIHVSNCAAQSTEPSEAQIKVAYLYNFAKLIEWLPESFKDANTPITLCVVGAEPFGGILEQSLAGRTANGHKLVSLRLNASDNFKACHILFISSSEKNRLPQILEALNGANVLTVGEMPQFAKSGGMINFFKEEKRVQFEINVEAVERAKLKISSRLLALAKLVKGNTIGGKT